MLTYPFSLDGGVGVVELEGGEGREVREGGRALGREWKGGNSPHHTHTTYYIDDRTHVESMSYVGRVPIGRVPTYYIVHIVRLYVLGM